ncbi:F0F1 ATP synthase subunit A [Kamptonema cortianum]|nr:F0F1 ATP synthase subunit A [Geitlerinema splendidum]MDK3155242.1 F0F1 ATP synthase subunit A [Kamptonema cortianum]
MQFLLDNAQWTLAASGEKGGPHVVHWNGLWFYIGLVVLIIGLFTYMMRNGLQDRVFVKRAAQLAEQLYVFLEGLCLGIIGPHGRKYMPMMTTFWLVIFVSNVLSLFFPTAPTADLSFNLGMALVAMAYVQWEGMKSNGVLGHFRHFAGPKMGIGLILINVMIFVIEIISEMMKNVSLSLRIYGNIDGGHQAADAMNKLGGNWVPVGAFLLPVKLLTCVVQALIFCLLVCVYISLVTHHEDDHSHGDEHAHGDDHAHGGGPAGTEPVPAH